MKARVHKHGAVATAASELLVTPSGFPVPWDPPPPAPHTQPPACGSLGGPLGCARGRPGGLPASRLVLLFAGRSPSRNHPQGQCHLLPLPRRLPCVLGGRGLPPGCACACVLLRVAPCLLVMWALKSRFPWPRPSPGPGPAQQLRGSSCPPVTVAPRTGRGGLPGEQSHQLQHRAWAVLSRGRPRWTLPRGVPPTLQVRVRRREEGQL